MDVSKLRAWWWHRQGLDGSLRGRPAAEVLDRAGWARSVGGVGPYLTFFSRAAVGRAAADAALAAMDIHELPGARGCTYVVPACDYALALRVGQGFNGDMATARKMGVTDKEIDRLCRKIAAALATGPLDPDQMRAAAGDAARSLGEEGKKRGLTTTLPLAIGRLQSEGEIRRVPTNGRLDQQRYRYALWRPNPLAATRLSEEQAHVELARRFFRWIAPATAGEFQAFSGLGAKVARRVLEPLGLVAVSAGGERLMLPEDRDRFERFTPAATPQYALASSLDALALLRRDLSLLLDPGDAKRKAAAGRSARELGGLTDLPSHAIFDRGRLVGLWEYDQDTESIAWWSFVKKDKALKEAVARTEAFVRDELGDARSFSLDSPKSRAPRIEALRRSARA